MSWDKMADRAVGPDCLSLGVKFLNCHLEMTINDYKVKRLLELLNTEWSSGRKDFTALAVAVLIGNVYAATSTSTWLRWTLHQLIAVMKVLIRTNFYQLIRTNHFNKLHAGMQKEKRNGSILPPSVLPVVFAHCHLHYPDHRNLAFFSLQHFLAISS